MVDNDKKDVAQPAADPDRKQRDRRAFLKKAAKAATVAPAVTLLMSADVKPAQATHYGHGS